MPEHLPCHGALNFCTFDLFKRWCRGPQGIAAASFMATLLASGTCYPRTRSADSAAQSSNFGGVMEAGMAILSRGRCRVSSGFHPNVIKNAPNSPFSSPLSTCLMRLKSRTRRRGGEVSRGREGGKRSDLLVDLPAPAAALRRHEQLYRRDTRARVSRCNEDVVRSAKRVMCHNAFGPLRARLFYFDTTGEEAVRSLPGPISSPGTCRTRTARSRRPRGAA